MAYYCISLALSLQLILLNYITIHKFLPPPSPWDPSTPTHALNSNPTLNSIQLNGLIHYFSADSGNSKGSFLRPPPSNLAD